MSQLRKFPFLLSPLIYMISAFSPMVADDPGFIPDDPPFGSEPDAPPTVDPGPPPDVDVPDLPAEEAVIAFFADDLFIFPGSVPATDQWYFSFTFKDIFHFSGDNWFYFQHLNTYLWVDTNSGSLSQGFWAYAIFPGQHSSWIFLARDGNFGDLRDSSGGWLPDSEAGNQTLSGYLFMDSPMPSDPQGSAWYYFSEFFLSDGGWDGNWLLNLSIPNPSSGDWHLLSGPVSTQ